MAKQESGLVEDTQKTSLFASSNSEGTFDNRIFRCLVARLGGRSMILIANFRLSKSFSKHFMMQSRHIDLYTLWVISCIGISQRITQKKRMASRACSLIWILPRRSTSDEVAHGTGQAQWSLWQLECYLGILIPTAITSNHSSTCLSGSAPVVAGGEAWPKGSVLTKWYTGSYEDIANAKYGNMGKSKTAGLAFEKILDEFPPLFDCVKPLCRYTLSV
jgi:hypothetical protein